MFSNWIISPFEYLEIDLTGGDIDATLSMNSWSYLPRDTDPEFAGVISNVHSSSLPGMPFRSGSHVCNGSVIPLGLVSQSVISPSL
jgi:hypothetical protein